MLILGWDSQWQRLCSACIFCVRVTVCQGCIDFLAKLTKKLFFTHRPQGEVSSGDVCKNRLDVKKIQWKLAGCAVPLPTPLLSVLLKRLKHLLAITEFQI